MKLRQFFTIAGYSWPAIAAATCAFTTLAITSRAISPIPAQDVVAVASSAPDNAGLGAFIVVGSLVLGLVAVFLGIFLYFLPWFIAAKRNHRNEPAILIVNLLLGWSLLGWVAALVWALYQERPPVAASYPLEA